MKADSIAIVSGGLDSITLLHYLVDRNRTPAVMTFRYNQRHEKEVELATEQVSSLGLVHEIVDLTMLLDVWSSSSLVNDQVAITKAAEIVPAQQPSTYVPNRNMIFLTMAIAWAETIGVTDVYYGAQKHDIYGYWDTKPEFVHRINAVYELLPKRISVCAPFLDLSKTEVLRIGLKLGVDYSKTWSCYVGEELACGQCPTCVERLKAFDNLGISDPIPYR